MQLHEDRRHDDTGRDRPIPFASPEPWDSATAPPHLPSPGSYRASADSSRRSDISGGDEEPAADGQAQGSGGGYNLRTRATPSEDVVAKSMADWRRNRRGARMWMTSHAPQLCIAGKPTLKMVFGHRRKRMVQGPRVPPLTCFAFARTRELCGRLPATARKGMTALHIATVKIERARSQHES